MKRFYALVLSLLLCFSMICSASATTVYTTDALRVRQKPNLKAKVVTVYIKGREVNELKHGKHWSKVSINGKIYYMNNKFLSKTKPDLTKEEQSELNEIAAANKEISSANPVETFYREPAKSYYSKEYFKKMGVIHWNGWVWTWYSQNVLPGNNLSIPGRHVDNEYIKDENGRLCLSSSVLSKGTILDTPFGLEGCIYDDGCSSEIIDVYVDF